MFSRVRAAAGYLLINYVLFLVCVFLSRLGLGALGMVVFPFPVAACFLRRRPGLGLGVILCAALAAWVGLQSGDAVIRYAIVSGLGIPLGLGVARNHGYGRTVALVAVCAYALIVGDIMSSWDSWRRDMADSYIAVSAGLTAQFEEARPEMVDAVRQTMVWLQKNGPDLALGMMLWPVLAGVCGAVSLMSRLARRAFGLPGTRGGFSSLKPPDWFVWIAIALFVAWYAEQRWPNPALRTFTWNAALAVAGVYWINGLSILAFAIRMLRPGLLILFLIAFLLINSQIHPLVVLAGLFDTWADFRDQVRKLVLRKMRLERARDDDKL